MLPTDRNANTAYQIDRRSLLLGAGGHGFGMGRLGTDSTAWPGWYEAWLRRAGMLG